jgi:hypothetical protein
MSQIQTFFILLLIALCSFAGNKCPPLNQDNIRSAWEGWSGNDICYFYMDLTNPNAGLFVISYWRDSTYTITFRLVQKQVEKGSIALFFESTLRASSDKIIVSGKGTACDTAGTIDADVQLLFKRQLFNKEVKLVFYQRVTGKPSAIDLLKTVSEECRKEVKKIKGGR